MIQMISEHYLYLHELVVIQIDLKTDPINMYCVMLHRVQLYKWYLLLFDSLLFYLLLQ